MKKLLCAGLLVLPLFGLSACAAFGGQPESSAPPALSSEPEVSTSSAPVSLGAMDANTAMDYCLRLYNKVHAVAYLSSAEALDDASFAELQALVAEMQRYGSEEDARTMYAVGMANLTAACYTYGTPGGVDSESLDVQVKALRATYNTMPYGFRQELKYLYEPEWEMAAKILSAKQAAS